MGIRRLCLSVANGLATAIIALTTACSSSEEVTVDWSAGDFQTVLESSIRQLRSETGLTGVAAAVITDGGSMVWPSAANADGARALR